MEKKPNFVGFSEMNSQKKWPISRNLAEKFGTNFAKTRLLKKVNFAEIFKPISLESNWFCADFMNVSNETKQQFCQFFFGGGGAGEGGNDER